VLSRKTNLIFVLTTLAIITKLLEWVSISSLLLVSLITTATSVSGFEVNRDQLAVGSNNIRVTFISSGGSSRTVSYTATRRESEVRSFSVRCAASYNDAHNADVECSTQTPESEDIATISYTLNGGARQTATSTSGFEVDKSQLTREVNAIIVTLVSTSGLTRDLTLNLGGLPLDPITLTLITHDSYSLVPK
jgi:hypothetical protein